MHEVLHVAVLLSTLAGAASLALLIVWPLAAEAPLAPATRWLLLGAVGLAVVLLALEWKFVH